MHIYIYIDNIVYIYTYTQIDVHTHTHAQTFALKCLLGVCVSYRTYAKQRLSEDALRRLLEATYSLDVGFQVFGVFRVLVLGFRVEFLCG